MAADTFKFDPTQIGLRMRQQRELFQYTQAELAQRLHFSPEYYRQVEQGKQPISLEMAVGFCAFFQISLDALLFDCSEKDPLCTPRDVLYALVEQAPESQCRFCLPILKELLIFSAKKDKI